MKRTAIVLALSTAHFVVSFGLMLWWLKMKMDLLEGEYRPLNTLEVLVKTGGELLSRPLAPLFPGLAPWFSYGINSLAWGIGLYAAGMLIRSAFKRRRPDGQTS